MLEIKEFSVKGLKLIRPKVFRDDRGKFFEGYRQSLYSTLGIDCPFVQDNLSFSKKNTIRGMHFQNMPGQVKLVSVILGKILDVVVDIRKNSPTFGKWEQVTLDDSLHEQLLIPVGFAHGFAVLSDTAIVTYKVSSQYDPNSEKSFRYDDPDININWPIQHPVISERDRLAPSFKLAMS
jgi:dTDP-4-dehydrorhamnose 3,5-epimerase